MADNVILNLGSGGDTIATDDIGGIEFQRVKLIHGADGVNAGDVSTANGLPVDIRSDAAGLATSAGQLADGHNVTVDNAAGAAAVNIQDGGNTISVDAASLPLPTGAATSAGQLADGHNVTVDNLVSAPAFTQLSDGTAAIAADATAGLKVDLGVDNDVTVAGVALAANQLADGHNVTVDNTVGAPANVQISDGVETALVTAAGELHTSLITALPTGANNIGDVDIASVIPVTATGFITSGGGNVIIDVGGYGSVCVQVTNTFVATLEFRGSVDGTNFEVIQAIPFASGTAVTTTTTTGAWFIPCGGVNIVQIIATSYGSGTADIDYQANIDGVKQATPAGGSGGSSQSDNTALSTANPMGAIFDTTPPTITDGNVGVPRMNGNRDLHSLVVTDDGGSAMDDTNSALRVNVVAGSGAGVSHVDDALFTVAVDDIVPAGGIFRSVRDLVDDNDAGALAMTQRRGLLATLEDSAGNEVSTGGGVEADALRVSVATDNVVSVDDNSGSLTVDAPVGTPAFVRLSDGTAAMEAIDAAAHGASQVGLRAMGTDGTNDRQIAVDATGNVQVDIVADAAGLALAANQLADGHNVTADAGTGDFLSISAHTANELLKEATAIGGEMDDTTTVLATEGNVSPARITANRAVHTTLRGIGANALDLNTGTRSTDTLRVTVATDDLVPISAASLPLPAGAATAANQTSVIGTDGAAGPASALSIAGTESGGNLQEVLVSATGAVQVDVLSGGGGPEVTEDAPAAADPVGFHMMARRQDTPASETSLDGDVTAVNCTDEGSLHMELRSGTGETGTAGTPLRIDPTGSTTQPISAASLPLPTGAATDTNQTSVIGTDGSTGPASVLSVGGTQATGEIEELRVDSDGHLQADVLSSALPTGAATSALQLPDGHDVTVDNLVSAPAFAQLSDGTAAIAADATDGLKVDLGVDNDVVVTGNVADDAADTGNPVKIGHKVAEFDTDPDTMSANADRVDSIATAQGIPYVLPGHPNIVSREFMTNDGETNTDMLGAVAAGSHVVLLGLEMLVDGAVSATVAVRVGFGTASVPAEPATGAGVNGVVMTHPGLAAGSGVVRGGAGGIIAVGASDEELRVTCGAPTGGQINFIITYYVATL